MQIYFTSAMQMIHMNVQPYFLGIFYFRMSFLSPDGLIICNFTSLSILCMLYETMEG